MNKIVFVLITSLFAIIIFGCSNDEKAENIKNSDETKQEVITKKTENKNEVVKKTKEKKEAEQKKKESEEKAKIAENNAIADDAIDNAEYALTWESYNTAKKAIDNAIDADGSLNRRLSDLGNTLTSYDNKSYTSTSNEATPASDKLNEYQQGDDSSKEPNDETNDKGYSIDESTLTGFINKHGVTPAYYKIKYEGMSEEEALRSTPRDMKTSGELQTEYMKYGR